MTGSTADGASYNELIEDVRYWRRCALSAADMHAATAQDVASASRSPKAARERLASDCEAIARLLDGARKADSRMSRVQAVKGRIRHAQRMLGQQEPPKSFGERELPVPDTGEREYLVGLDSSRVALSFELERWRGVVCEIGAMAAQAIEASDRKTVSKREKRRQNDIGEFCVAMLDGAFRPRDRSIERIRDRVVDAGAKLGAAVPSTSSAETGHPEASVRSP